MGKCLFMRKGETHSAPSVGLPSGYTELGYIKSTGTQYINTEFIPNNNTRVVMDAELTGHPTGNASLFGARTDATVNAYGLSWYHSGQYFRSFYNNKYTASVTWNVSSTGRRIYEKNKETTIIDGVSQSYTNETFQCEYEMLLLAMNDKGTHTWMSEAKLYSCQVYDNGTLIRDFIPCINPDGEIGMYDKVNRQFYGNSGTGTFIGSEVA